MKRRVLTALLLLIAVCLSGCFDTVTVKKLSSDPVQLQNSRIAVKAIEQEELDHFFEQQMKGYLNSLPDIKILSTSMIKQVDDRTDGALSVGLVRIGSERIPPEAESAIAELDLNYVLQLVVNQIRRVTTTTYNSSGSASSRTDYRILVTGTLVDVNKKKPVRRITVRTSARGLGCITGVLVRAFYPGYQETHTCLDLASSKLSKELANRYYRHIVEDK